MTFEEAMTKFGGYWDSDRAWVKGQDGYFWCIATGSPADYCITIDGKRYWDETPAEAPAPTPKRGRSKATPVQPDEPVVPVEPLGLDPIPDEAE